MREFVAVSLFGIFVTSAACAQQATPVETRLSELIRSLETTPWTGPVRTSKTDWNFRFTAPMKEIIAIGPDAQDSLIAALSNRKTLDQVIMLLGAVGDERAVPHLINAMIYAKDFQKVGDAIHVNLCANLALTNITVADVIWHHGGGINVFSPPDPKRSWISWWEKNKKTFTVKGITTSRRYSNYPNYGIYRFE